MYHKYAGQGRPDNSSETNTIVASFYKLVENHAIQDVFIDFSFSFSPSSAATSNKWLATTTKEEHTYTTTEKPETSESNAGATRDPGSRVQ
ncbi:uncharacterized protein LAJ45_11072 [Morchella importuna]|uniref:uncharacterized protein n=1 Tax=Morchella importuna TaxID=1174673 RepID=UPI001E8DF1EB|nr:uncharacterized protein LAJ45_11072 [Morchella importuna]KAH8144951.1 hypothetical protein LAJ45_11072 [Morchella importuna]